MQHIDQHDFDSQIDIFSWVYKMRNHRVFMVQTEVGDYSVNGFMRSETIEFTWVRQKYIYTFS